MRAIGILQTALDCSLQHIHSRRRDALWRAVAGVALGGKLWLTALGRSLPGQSSDKHRIKAADRLLGNQALHDNLIDFYSALAFRLLRHTTSPVVAVDWSGLGRHYMLSAHLCCDGRALHLYNRVYPKSKLNNPRVHKEFLVHLATILPSDCKPIIVSDAGFRSPWFEAVRAQGWEFVGRVRSPTKCCLKGQWVKLNRLHSQATSSPRNLGEVLLCRNKPKSYRVVLSAMPKLKGRKRLTSQGKAGRKTVDRRCSAAARQPWVLTTSLSCNPKVVVQIYGLRMQIEQSFRDEKNHRHGWSLEHAGSRCPKRLEVLLLIAALSQLVVHIAGRAAERQGLQRHFQANTIRCRRVLSVFVLGLYVIKRNILLAHADLRRSLDESSILIAKNAPL